MSIRYSELKSFQVTQQVVDDINRLLPQLSTSADPITKEWLNYVLESTRIFVARDDGHIIGTVLLHAMPILVGQKDWIEDVVVDEAYRRQGISSELMSMAEIASRLGRAKSVNLTSNPDRDGARAMYGNRGYKIRDTGVFRLTH